MGPRVLILAGLVVCLALFGLATAGAPSANPGQDRLVIGAYSVVREALHEGVLPAFAARWKKDTGRTVSYEESYNGSGAQARAILAGFDADVTLLSLENDVGKLVKAGLVRSSWNKGPDRGIVTHSLVVIGFRPGNPKGVRDWDDLARPGVGVLVPDPKTSGGARWNNAAIYGAGLKRGGPEAAANLLARVVGNVVTMDASGRQSMATFERGTGDAIVTYEHELVLKGQMTGVEIPYVIPSPTLVIEAPAAVIEPSVARHGNRALAEAFLAYLRSDEAQRIFARYGFRPLSESFESGGGPLPRPRGLFTIDQLGGWRAVNRTLFDPGGVWDSIFTRPLARK
jgi:sulfate/thiosulfate transport system substrate-binding protein